MEYEKQQARLPKNARCAKLVRLHAQGPQSSVIIIVLQEIDKDSYDRDFQ
jgi:hypothetical protein